MIIKKRRGFNVVVSIFILLTSYTTAVFGASATPAKSSTQKQSPHVVTKIQPLSVITPAYSPQDVRLTNVRDTQFTVSWVTKGMYAGKINYGETSALGKPAYDDRGERISGRVHHVTVKHLNPNTRYYFQIVSGNKIYKNGKEPYTCLTGPTIIPAKCDVAYGRLYKKFNIRHKIPYGREAIVYLTLVNKDTSGSAGESTAESIILDKNSYWSCELANIRETGLARLFDYSDAGDMLKIEAETGVYPTAVITMDTANDSPAKDIEIPQPKIKKVKGR